MRYALIDLGSNSVRMTIAETLGSAVTILAKRREMTRLRQGMEEDMCLKEQPMERTIHALRAFAAEAKEQNAAVFAAATAAVRTAANGREFCRRVLAETGIRLYVISGQREAQLDFQGIMQTLPEIQTGLIVDTGGGSTELILFENRTLQDKISLPLGAASLHEQAKTLDKAEKTVQQALLQVPFLNRAAGKPLIGIGGSVFCLWTAEQFFTGEQAESSGVSLPPNRAEMLYQKLSVMSPAQRIAAGIEPGRSETVCFGILPSLTLLRRLSPPALYLSAAGLREGMLFELLRDGAEKFQKNLELF